MKRRGEELLYKSSRSQKAEANATILYSSWCWVWWSVLTHQWLSPARLSPYGTRNPAALPANPRSGSIPVIVAQARFMRAFFLSMLQSSMPVFVNSGFCCHNLSTYIVILSTKTEKTSWNNAINTFLKICRLGVMVSRLNREVACFSKTNCH